MTWQEMDYSSGAVSVGDLLKGERVEFSDTDISLETKTRSRVDTFLAL
jgi:hypothetical protein